MVNADDFGLSPAVTAGILEAHAAGTVSSTSMMVHCPGWDDAAARARATSTLGVGLHFNLLLGTPLTAAASLRRPTGEFLSLGALARRALRGALRTDDIVAECEAQLAALAGAGIRVTHIDSHRHTHALPVVHGAVARVAVAHGLPLRRPVESPLRFGGDPAGQVRGALVAWSWRLSSIGAPPTHAPDHFIGMSLQGRRRFASRLAHVLGSLPCGTSELMVHPGRVDAALAAIDGYTWPRERERAALTDPALVALFQRFEIALVDFSAL
ncbi:MAG: ChbG/HpnK family deacetylase [Gemmatimonadaceae bacterium]